MYYKPYRKWTEHTNDIKLQYNTTQYNIATTVGLLNQQNQYINNTNFENLSRYL